MTNFHTIDYLEAFESPKCGVSLMQLLITYPPMDIPFSTIYLHQRRAQTVLCRRRPMRPLPGQNFFNAISHA